MIRFFIDKISGARHILRGEDAHHAIKSLRIGFGEKIILCDKSSIEYICSVEKILNQEVHVNVIRSQKCVSEPDTKITLYQALPKSDKMDLIIQKSVELGVFEVVPTITSRCVSKPDEKSLMKKVDRWQKIAREAAKQSGRGIIPKILSPLNFEDAVSKIAQYDKTLIFYENGGAPIKAALEGSNKNLAIFIGPEGGFETTEVELIKSSGAVVCTLGNRILRTETAAIAALAIILNMLEQ